MKFNKHIVWITPGFAKSELDSTTIPTMQALALEFKRANPEATLEIVTIHFPFQPQSYLWNEIKVHCIGGANVAYPMRFAVWRRAIKKLSEIHLSKPIDVVHSFWYSEPAFLANRFCRKRSVAHVCSIMGQDAQKSNRYLALLKSKRIVTVAISNRTAEDFFIASGLKADEIIPFGIDKIDVSIDRLRRIDVVGVGGLSSVKRFDKFLRIVGLVSLVRADIKVLLIGDGPERAALEKLVKALGLHRIVQFVGKVPRNEVIDLMAQSKILLHTSISEGMGYVFLEAAACGCYIVATPVGIVSPDQFSFVNEDEGYLANSILNLLDSDILFASRYPYVLQRTSLSYANLYSKVMSR